MNSVIRKATQSEWGWVLMGGLIVLALGTLFLQGCSQSPINSGDTSSEDAIATLETIEQLADGPSTVRAVLEVERVYEPTIVGSDCAEDTFGSGA